MLMLKIKNKYYLKIFSFKYQSIREYQKVF